MDLLNHIFSMQKKIDNIVPDKYELVDAGMYIPTGGETELWRDNCLYDEENDKDYAYRFSTSGKLEGEVPPEMVLSLPLVLQENAL